MSTDTETKIVNYWKEFFPECTMDEFMNIVETYTGKKMLDLIKERTQNQYSDVDILKFFRIEQKHKDLFDQTGANYKWKGFVYPIVNYYFESTIQRLYLNNQFLVGDKAIDKLLQNLFDICHKIIFRTMVLELNIAREEKLLVGNDKYERAKYFSEILLNDTNYLKKLYSLYPELVLCLQNKIKNYFLYFIEILNNIENKSNEIEEEMPGYNRYGRIVEIDFGSGDTHRNGRAVSIIKYENGKLVYKPHDLKMDKSFQMLIEWLNEQSITGFIDLKTPKMYSNDDFGLMEYIKFEECKDKFEISDFYKRMGEFLGIFYTLNANDMHYENIIAKASYPMMIDLETVFHPIRHLLSSNENNLDYKVNKEISRSVSSISLLPSFIINKDDKLAINIGGMALCEPQKSPFKGWFIKDYDTDKASIIEGYGMIQPKDNNPMLLGEIIKSDDFVQDILLGFSCIYNWINDNKELYLQKVICLFRDVKCRYVHRPTNVYSRFLDTSYHPDILQRNVDRLVYLCRMGIGCQSKILQEIAKSEILDLKRGDIPSFHIGITDNKLYSSEDKFIKAPWKLTPLEEVEEKIYNMGKADYQRQIAIIKAHYRYTDYTINKTGLNFFSGNTIQEYDREKMVCDIEQIADLLLDKSIYGHTNSGKIGRTWVGLRSMNEHTHYVDCIGNALYSGNGGVALFIAYLAMVTQDKKWFKLTDEIVETILEEITTNGVTSSDNIGAFAGVFGEIYIIDIISTLLDDAALGKQMKEALISAYNRFDRIVNVNDIINGYAGILGVFLHFYEKYKSQELLNICSEIADKIIKNSKYDIESGGIYWDDGYSGYAHGNAGISAQLSRYVNISRDIQKNNYISQAIQFDRSLVDNNNGMWKKRINDPFVSYTWCNGATGMLLNRITLKKSGYKDETIDFEITKLVEAVKNNGFGKDYAICHGDLGNLAILKYVANQFDDISLYNACDATCFLFYQTYYNLNNFLEEEVWGFMTGLSGIGVSLLDFYTGKNYIANILMLK